MNWPLKDCWYYQSIKPEARFSGMQLNGDQQAGIVIIGGGFAGLATAIGLVERGYRDIVILESETVGYGASGRNGGFIMAGYSLPEAKLIGQMGVTAARNLYQLTVAAQSTIKQRIRDYQIDCDLVDGGIVLADWFKREHGLRQHQTMLNERLGANWEYLTPQQLSRYVVSQRYGGGLLEPDGAHFHPLKYLYGLARQLIAEGVRIYHHSRVEAIDKDGSDWQVRVSDGRLITAQQVVICAGGYIKGLQVPIATAILPIATYIISAGLSDEQRDRYLPGQAAIYDTRFAFDYYRIAAENQLLWGGRIAVNQPSAARIERLLKRDLNRVFPELSDLQISAAWGGLMGYTRPQMPSISQSEDGLWHALGFGGHGVCPTTVAGEILAAALTGDSRQTQLFEAFRLPSAYGWVGLLGAQSYYWWRQLRDVLQV